MKFKKPKLDMILIRIADEKTESLSIDTTDGNRLVVEVDESYESPSGLILTKEKPANEWAPSPGALYIEAEVMDVGPGNCQNGVLMAPDVKVGESVWMLKASNRVEICKESGYTYYMMSWYNLMAGE